LKTLEKRIRIPCTLAFARRDFNGDFGKCTGNVPYKSVRSAGKEEKFISRLDFSDTIIRTEPSRKKGTVMIDSISTAVRGMLDQESRVEASARRLAGMGGTPKPATKPPAGSTTPASPPATDLAAAEPSGAPGFLLDVDIATEMVNVKIAEKIYEANAKVVETAGKMIAKTVDIKA
jgi:hypothetical protein